MFVAQNAGFSRGSLHVSPLDDGRLAAVVVPARTLVARPEARHVLQRLNRDVAPRVAVDRPAEVAHGGGGRHGHDTRPFRRHAGEARQQHEPD